MTKWQNEHGEIRIGWASADTTPARPVILRGQFHTRISEGVNDPITATVLAIETKDDQAIMVSCDRVNIPAVIQAKLRDLVRARVAGFDTQKLFLNATHTHTAPVILEGIYPEEGPGVMTPTEYAGFFLERVSDAVVNAWESRAPGGVSWAYGHAVVGHNRRMTYFDGTSKMYGNTSDEDFSHIEGYEDHGVDMLFLWDQDDNLTGVVINLACPSQVTESERYVSADFWHEAREEIRKRHSKGVFILPQCAAGGDQSPHLLLHKRAEEHMRRIRGVTEREEIGIRIADALDNVLPVAKKTIQRRVLFRHIVRRLDLPVREVTEEECKQAEAQRDKFNEEYERTKDSRAFVHRRRNTRVVQRYKEQQQEPFYKMELHVIRLGEIAIATNPFELFLDFGLRIKARSRALQTFIVQLVGDAGGYVPTARAVAARSYGAEISSNEVGPEGGQVLVNETLASINQLWADLEAR